jgi:hypothetical protein
MAMLPPDERAKILREAPPQTWIAFPADESEVVAQAKTHEEAVSIAECKGVNDPVLLMTPESWVPMFLGSAFVGNTRSL